jgi:hypothetical protein
MRPPASARKQSFRIRRRRRRPGRSCRSCRSRLREPR